MGIFSGQKQDGPAFTNLRTIVEDGNVAPGQAFKHKKRKVNEDGEEVSGDSSMEEDVEAEVLDEEEQNKQTGPT